MTLSRDAAAIVVFQRWRQNDDQLTSHDDCELVHRRTTHQHIRSVAKPSLYDTCWSSRHAAAAAATAASQQCTVRAVAQWRLHVSDIFIRLLIYSHFLRLCFSAAEIHSSSTRSVWVPDGLFCLCPFFFNHYTNSGRTRAAATHRKYMRDLFLGWTWKNFTQTFCPILS